MSPVPLPARTPAATEQAAASPESDALGPAALDDPACCAGTPGQSLRCRFGRLAARTAAAVGAAHRAGVPF